MEDTPSLFRSAVQGSFFSIRNHEAVILIDEIRKKSIRYECKHE